MNVSETDMVAAKRIDQAARARASRANITASQKDQTKAKNAARNREKRMRLAEQERDVERELESLSA